MIDIYMNTREWGGVDVLVARFAEYLQSVGSDFKIIDNAESRLREQIPWAKFLTDEEARGSKSAAGAVLFPSIAKLRDPLIPWGHFRNDARAFSWIVHPNDVAFSFMPLARRAVNRFGMRVYPPLRLVQSRHYHLMQESLLKFIDAGAVATMDGATARSLQHFYNISKLPTTIPIPSPTKQEIPRRKEKEFGSIVVGYLGRLDTFKWSALKPFILHELGPIAKAAKVSLLAVSDGPHADELRSICKRLGIQLEITGFLPNEEARSRLAKHVDLAVAMGTSALDLAAEGIPCLIIDPSLRAMNRPQDTYRFVHETDDYTLGEFRDFPAYRATGRPFLSAITDLENGAAGQKDRDYVSLNHDPARIFPQLHSHILSSELTVDQLELSVSKINHSFSRNASLFGLR